MEPFAHIKRVIEINEFDLIVFCGDINSDFKRNSGFVQSVRNQVEDMSLDTAKDMSLDTAKIEEKNVLKKKIFEKKISFFCTFCF